MRGSLLEFLDAVFGSRNPKPPVRFQIRSLKSTIRNAQTPKRGQGAQCPDRFMVRKRLISRRFFSE